MASRLSVDELRNLFEHGTTRNNDLQVIRQTENIFLSESTTVTERKENEQIQIQPEEVSESKIKTELDEHVDDHIDEHDDGHIDEHADGQPDDEHVDGQVDDEHADGQTDDEHTDEHTDEQTDDEHADGKADDEDDLVAYAENHLFNQNFQFNTEREIYEVIFDADCTEGLGMVVQQQDEEVPGTNRIREHLVVEVITKSGAAAKKGITEGSILLKVNEVEVLDKSYVEALTLLKQSTRPLVLTFKKGLGVCIIQGYCFKATTGSLNPPKRFNAWKLRYFVLGGPVARNNSFQLYKSKSDFDQVVVSVVSRKPVTQKFKAYFLSNDCNCSTMKLKRYDSHSTPFEFFSIRCPPAHNKVMHIARIPSDSTDGIRNLYNQITEMTTFEA